MKLPPMHLIAAADAKMGIGKDNQLPWKLPKEFSYFVNTTKKTVDPNKRNAVIIGRKTYEGVPKSHRPFQGRLNIVLSRTTKDIYGADIVCGSLDQALELLTQPPYCHEIESVFNVGGEEVYKAGLTSPACSRIYLTRVFAEFDCDTHFPPFNTSQFRLISSPDIPADIQEENGIKYQFEVYEKISPGA